MLTIRIPNPLMIASSPKVLEFDIYQQGSFTGMEVSLAPASVNKLNIPGVVFRPLAQRGGHPWTYERSLIPLTRFAIGLVSLHLHLMHLVVVLDTEASYNRKTVGAK